MPIPDTVFSSAQTRIVGWALCPGAEMKIAHVAEDKNPVVLGRLGREPGLPTIAFYGHYDVQVCPIVTAAWSESVNSWRRLVQASANAPII